MSLKRLLAPSLALLALTTGCASNIYSAPPQGIAPGPALWAVADADTTIYLFGTVHALPKDKPWMDARISGALAASDELVTEVDLTDLAGSAQVLAAAGMLPPGQTLRGMMDEQGRKDFEAAMVGLGLPVEALDRAKPWLAAMQLALLPLVKAGITPDSGVEKALGGQAGSEKKRAALETVQQQVDVFDTMPQDVQLAFLYETVRAVPRSAASLQAMIAEWSEGDAEQLAALMNADLTNPQLYQRLLVQRNANWSVWLDDRMDRPGTVFVAVGAGHLAGKASVQELLRKRGFKVRRVWQ